MLGIQKKNKKKVAIKISGKSNINEIVYLKRLKNVPGIPKLIGYWQHNYRLHYVITQRFGHMNLNQFIMIKNYIPRHYIHRIIHQLLSIVACLNQFNILHCNIRCTNISIDVSTLKIILTGFSSCLKLKHDYYYTKINHTNSYTLPEWLKFKRFTAKGLTVWTIGIVLYCLVYKKKPFYSKNSILHKQLSFPKKPNASLETLAFLNWCLTKNPNKRMSLVEMKIHPWITNSYI